MKRSFLSFGCNVFLVVGLVSLGACAKPTPPLTPAQYGARHVTDVFIRSAPSQEYYYEELWQAGPYAAKDRRIVQHSGKLPGPATPFMKVRLNTEIPKWEAYAPHLEDPSDGVRLVLGDALPRTLGKQAFFDLRVRPDFVERVELEGDPKVAGAARVTSPLPAKSPDAEWALILVLDDVGLILGDYEVQALLVPPSGLYAFVSGRGYLVESATGRVLWSSDVAGYKPLGGDLDDVVSRKATDYPRALPVAIANVASGLTELFVRGRPGATKSEAEAAGKIEPASLEKYAEEFADLDELVKIVAAAPPKPVDPVAKAKGLR